MIEFFIRIFAFVRKELAEVLRQPRLILTLIVGPFLILLIFGVGYDATPRTMRTLVVVPPDSQIEGLVEEYTNRISGQLQFMGIVSDVDEAKEQLRDRVVDMVLVTPSDPFQDIRHNKQALFELYHYEIDPFESTYVDVIERVYLTELNRQVLIRAVNSSKTESESIQGLIDGASDDVGLMRQALEAGDGAAAAEYQQQLQEDIGLLKFAAGSGLLAYSLLQSNPTADPENLAQDFADGLALIEESLNELDPIEPEQVNYDEELEVVEDVDTSLTMLDENLSRLQEIDSEVLVEPFKGETHSVSLVTIDDVYFFAPAVIALLLQHISITLAALSIVGERRSGAVELFRASPVSAFETMLGKYLSYLLFITVIAGVLTVLVIFVLNVPMLGNWFNYGLAMLLVTLASLGVGFFISLISRSDSQAVQYAMIVLLASIFFSGFFLALYRLRTAVHVLSWSLPATYGINMLQDIMLRGQVPRPAVYWGVSGIALFLFVVSTFRLSRVMKAK